MPKVTILNFTALPNGVAGDNQRARATVFLSPQVDAGTDATNPFVNWAQWALDNHWNDGWIIRINGSAVPKPNINVVSRPPDPLLWRAVFDGYSDNVTARRKLTDMANAWVISHNAQKIHTHVRQERLRQSQIRLASTPAGSRAAANIPQWRAESVRAHDEMTLYIHPRLGTSGSQDVAKELDGATEAMRFFRGGGIFAGVAPADVARVGSRISHGLKRLGSDSRRLRAAALLALFSHCADSAGGAVAAVINSNIATEMSNAAYPPGTAALVTEMRAFVEFHLFHRRSREEHNAAIQAQSNCNPDSDDFHTALARVNQFPAMLRQLGLAVDFEFVPPGGAVTTIAISNPTNIPGINQVPFVTNCTLTRSADGASLVDFYATSDTTRPGLLTPAGGSSRFLFLQATDGSNPLFQFVSEDTDGSAQKSSQQADADLRSQQYASSASATTGDPASPSARTVGVTLLYSLRADRTRQALAANASLAGGATPSLWAEDLVLGYRIDVKNGNDWLSLSARQGKYEIFNARGVKQRTFEPAAGLEGAADDGFISPMASSPVPDPNNPPPNNEPVIQVHESIFTWTGWSLSIPPLFKSFNTNSNSCPEPVTRIRPEYRLPAKHQLPPLRFDRSYTFRCRAVDLAGNSVDVTAQNVPAGALMDHSMERLEPIRPPHILINEPLKRVSHPGEQVDVLVIRDGGGFSARILAAPREPLRIAELSDKLTATLPETAFRLFFLETNGSFPSVKQASDQGLLDSTPEGKETTWNDSLFLLRKGNTVVNCPYYPDPLAEFVRIVPSLVLDPAIDPNETNPFAPVYLGLYTDSELEPGSKTSWPDCGPIRLRLEDAGGQRPQASKMMMIADDNDGTSPLVRGLLVKVPKARTVTMQISSAACLPGQTTLPSGAKIALFSLHANLKGNPLNVKLSDLLDGSHPPQTPLHQVTLVHAVRRPLKPPCFVGFDVQRTAIGANDAKVFGVIDADWWSTGKVTCQASWEDCIDDLKQPGPRNQKNSEVAFDLLAVPTDVRLANKQVHHFRDTRAHAVTYELKATTRFRGYYSETDKESMFEVQGAVRSDIANSLGIAPVIVRSSVRPPAPSIAYIVPAFKWEEGYQSSSKTWVRGRVSALRIYVERPFRVSGNEECIGIALTPSGANRTVAELTSRWGLDPLRGGGESLGMRELAATDFAGGEQVAPACVLSEKTDTSVDVVPYKVSYAEERGLWFCDVRINSADAYYPFVRLGVVRYQPHAFSALTHDVGEARISPVVVADFMQIAPNRWVHLQKKDGKTISLSISGVSYSDAEAAAPPDSDPPCTGATGRTAKHTTFKVTVQQRWHALGKELGWRPVDCQPIPNCGAAGNDHVNVWRYDVHLPHSTSTHKYRLLIEEYEWLNVDESVDINHPVPAARLVYADFFEL
jgi:hypothetical protein